jgi:hypothetical protein
MLLLAGPAHAEKVAIVVGVGNYLAINADLTPACERDAAQMTAILSGGDFHFRVVTLTNEQATKQGILDALRRERGIADQLIFYFSGHGSQDEENNPIILPSDFTDAGDNGLTAIELRSAVSGVGARATAIILDTCYSGSMMDGRPLLSGVTAKYYRWRGVRRRKLRGLPLLGEGASNRSNSAVMVERGREPATLQPADYANAGVGNICYLTASSATEVAWCDNQGSFFTMQLGAALHTNDRAWGSLYQSITVGLQQDMARVNGGVTQTPQLTPGFYNRIYFGNGMEIGQGSYEVTKLSDVFNMTNDDPATLDIELLINGGVKRNQMYVSPNDDIEYKVKAGREGYLVMFNYDARGKIKVIHPENQNLGQAVIRAGATRRFPLREDRFYHAEEHGLETMKAILFTSEAAARTVLQSFAADSYTASEAKDKTLTQGLRRTQPTTDSFFTAEVKVEGQVEDT